MAAQLTAFPPIVDLLPDDDVAEPLDEMCETEVCGCAEEVLMDGGHNARSEMSSFGSTVMIYQTDCR